ncbi:hypothetical protein ACTQ4K_18630 [Clostridium sporogenes]|uniref:hypothetical protein n=1 Tax=Clostridium sporogenes TaxID=1509 RepID=UPI003F93BBDB
MQARKLMRDRELAAYLDINNSNLSFEYYENKYLKQGYTGNLLYRKILEASNRTNKEVNKQLGIM